MKKSLRVALTACAFLLLSVNGLQAGVKIVNKEKKLYNEIDQSYDYEHGWWFYEEEVPDKNGKKKKIKYKLDPVQKKQLEILNKIAEELEKQNKINEKILSILEYQFPRTTPKYGINKKTGEKCIANSSADCFVMPVVPEAQHIPVLAKFLRSGKMEDAKEYLKWQATYFNHLTNVGFALNYTYKQYGDEVYPTDAYSQSMSPFGISAKPKTALIHGTIKKLANNLKIKVFLGKTKGLEDILEPRRLLNINSGVLKHIKDFAYVFYTKERMYDLLTDIKEKYIYTDNYFKIFNRAKRSVNKKMFDKYKIDVTPTVVVEYIDPATKKGIWQKILIGDAREDIIVGIYNFLLFNNVIQPGNINERSLWQASGSVDKGEIDISNIEFKTGSGDFKVTKEQRIENEK